MKTLKTRLNKWAGLVRGSVKNTLDPKASTAKATAEVVVGILVAGPAFIAIVVLGL